MIFRKGTSVDRAARLYLATWFLVSPSWRLAQRLMIFGLLSACFVGCSSERNEVSVSGVVKVADADLDVGLITFVPIEGTPGPKISTQVNNGKYMIAMERGLAAGKYRVEVYGVPPGIQAMAHGERPSHDPHTESYREIAARFNQKSELKAELELGENQEDFEVAYAE